MATVDGAARPDVARAADTRLWQAALALGLVLCAVQAAVPAQHVVFRDLILYPLIELGAVAAILVGVRRYRPADPRAWLLIAGCLFLFACGDLVWGIYEVMDRDPFPSVADAFYLSGYPLLFAGLVVAIRRGTPSSDKRALLEAGMVGVSAALITWVYVVQPARADPSLTTLETAVVIAYPLADVLVLAAAVRYILGASWHALALRLLVLGLGLTLVGDSLYALDVLSRVEGGLRLVDTLLLLGVVAIGLAGLHRSMPALTEPPEQVSPRLGTAWLALLVGIFLVPPAVLLVQAARGKPLYLTAAIVATTILSFLLVARFADVTARARRAAEREAALSRYAGELLRADGTDELFAVATRTANELTNDGRAQLVRASEERDTHSFGFVAPIEVRGEVVGELAADPQRFEAGGVSDSLTTVASELSLALERDRLRATEREAAKALAEQNERLREIDAMKAQFVSMVSHELRTPLTSMVGYLELVLDGKAGELNEDQQHFLEIANRASHRLNLLIEDILDVSRIDAGRLSLEREWIDVVELVNTAVEADAMTAKRKDVDLKAAARGEPGQLWADPKRLTQVLDNLISNAIKFTPEGGTVAVTTAPADDGVRIAVSDNGVGIPEDEIDRLFERFFRASTGVNAPGTGLGLSISKSMVEMHGGTISVESKVDHGSTFVVDLPIQSPSDSGIGDAAGEVRGDRPSARA